MAYALFAPPASGETLTILPGNVRIYLDSKFSSKQWYQRRVRGSFQHVMKNKAIDFRWDMFFNMSLGTLSGIQRLHENEPQILHRDLKSLNLLVTNNFEIKVADFGLAHINNCQSSALFGLRGTANYMAPELLDTKFSTKSDVYSLAIIHWEMIHRVMLGVHEQPYHEIRDPRVYIFPKTSMVVSLALYIFHPLPLHPHSLSNM
eukprot:TRINITY_DN5262_c0_g1_i2.p1 TRINITY_DN5262_c0_g1~~TRINITY_DN5262_c0_g1_i2.p1  ORF type:complete len:204 (+),score=33.47 TRINITY_DN5262_c0_g1_i2:54-665(+)